MKVILRKESKEANTLKIAATMRQILKRNETKREHRKGFTFFFHRPELQL